MGRQNIVIQKSLTLGSHVNIKWNVDDFEEVKEGQQLATVECETNFPIYSSCDGVCRIIQKICLNVYGDDSDILGFIYNKGKEDFPNIPKDTIDPLSQAHTIEWEKLGGYKSAGIPLTIFNNDYLYISCDYREQKAYLVVRFLLSKIKIKKSDTISLKFSNGKVLNFTLKTRPVKVIEDCFFPEDDKNADYCSEMSKEKAASWRNSDYYFREKDKYKTLREVRFALSDSDLWTLANSSLVLYRLTYNSVGGDKCDNIPYNFEMSPAVCAEVIKNMFKTLKDRVCTFDKSYYVEKSVADTKRNVSVKKNVEELKDTCNTRHIEREAICLDQWYDDNLPGWDVKYELKVENFADVEEKQVLAYAVFPDLPEYNTPIPIYSKNKGCCRIIHSQEELFHSFSGEILGFIYTKGKEDFPNIPTDGVDEFSGNRFVKWKKVGGYKSVGIPLTVGDDDNLYISCIYKDNNVCLDLCFLERLGIEKGDAIRFKFSNGEILEFYVNEAPAHVLFDTFFPEDDSSNHDYHEDMAYERIYKIKRTKEYKFSNLRRLYHILSDNELTTFVHKSVVSYEILLHSKQKTLGDIPYNYEMSPTVCSEVIKDMFNVLIEQIGKSDET